MKVRRSTFVAIALFICAVTATAATFIVPPDRQMVQGADAIVAGSGINSYSQKVDGRIETVTTYSVHEVLKGSVENTIDIHEPGGRVGDQMTMIPGVPRFENGEEPILFRMQ